MTVISALIVEDSLSTTTPTSNRRQAHTNLKAPPIKRSKATTIRQRSTPSLYKVFLLKRNIRNRRCNRNTNNRQTTFHPPSSRSAQVLVVFLVLLLLALGAFAGYLVYEEYQERTKPTDLETQVVKSAWDWYTSVEGMFATVEEMNPAEQADRRTQREAPKPRAHVQEVVRVSVPMLQAISSQTSLMST